MNSPNINYVWAELIVEELLRNGIDRFVISPGSRNSPLIVAAAKHPETKNIVHADERGAAFFALGYAKANGKPAVLIATSGTAAANYFPAVCEAGQAGVPMILLTTDRPVELRDTGAAQTMEQVGLYGNYLRWRFDLPAPSTEVTPRMVLTTVDQAVYRAVRSPAGAVQINCQFREPLAPENSGMDFTEYLRSVVSWQQNGAAFTRYFLPIEQLASQAFTAVSGEIEKSRRGIIVVGPMQAHAPFNHILPVLQQLGMPILIDIASGLRFVPDAQNAVVLYDYFLRAEEFIKSAQPDFILHLGGPPRSKPLNNFLQNSRAKYVLVNNLPFRQDPFHRVDLRFELSPDRFCRVLLQNGVNATSELLPIFMRAENRASAVLNEWFDTPKKLSEPAILRSVLHHLPGDNNLYLANSMPVRDADAAGIFLSENNRIGVNFGVNGIDGTIASAVGFAAGNRQPTTAVLGDLAFLHDLNSLQLLRRSSVPVIVIVINNNGGGIFSFLPIARYEEVFTEYFGTPQNLGFKNAAALFELSYFAPRNLAEFCSVYKSALAAEKSSVIEIQTDRDENYTVHQELWELVTAQVAREINE